MEAGALFDTQNLGAVPPGWQIRGLGEFDLI
jgi:hypothetical protein